MTWSLKDDFTLKIYFSSFTEMNFVVKIFLMLEQVVQVGLKINIEGRYEIWLELIVIWLFILRTCRSIYTKIILCH